MGVVTPSTRSRSSAAARYCWSTETCCCCRRSSASSRSLRGGDGGEGEGRSGMEWDGVGCKFEQHRHNSHVLFDTLRAIRCHPPRRPDIEPCPGRRTWPVDPRGIPRIHGFNPGGTGTDGVQNGVALMKGHGPTAPGSTPTRRCPRASSTPWPRYSARLMDAQLAKHWAPDDPGPRERPNVHNAPFPPTDSFPHALYIPNTTSLSTTCITHTGA